MVHLLASAQDAGEWRVLESIERGTDKSLLSDVKAALEQQNPDPATLQHRKTVLHMWSSQEIPYNRNHSINQINHNTSAPRTCRLIKGMHAKLYHGVLSSNSTTST